MTDRDMVLHKPKTPTRVVESNSSNIVQKEYIANHINVPVYIFLSTSIRLECIILSFDDTCLITTQKNNSKNKQLVMLHHITSIVEISDYR